MSDTHIDRRALGLLILLPALACLPAWVGGRLLGPGDGAALHYPLRVAAWEAIQVGELPSWNHGIFGGTPLLAAYRPGALHPAMLLLAGLPPFAAFQILVMGSLAGTGALLYLYLRRIGCDPVGAYFGGLGFALGPYLIGNLGDTATLVAAPALPLVLIAAEACLDRPGAARSLGLAASVTLLLLAGSFAASGVGLALLAGRLCLVAFTGARAAAWRGFVASVAGIGLAGPQLVPTAFALLDAGRQVSGLADATEPLPGAAGLVLRYVSHTPAGALALAALPLALHVAPVRVLVAALSLCVALRWGRGPLAAPGALPLAFDLLLAMLAAFSLSAQWRGRREESGARLRAYFLFWSLASAAALSVSAAALGALPHTLAGSVGVLALSLILYFSFAGDSNPTRARVWLLPLSVSFLLQPQGRQIFQQTPTRLELEQGTPTRAAIDRILGRRSSERILTLTPDWPPDSALDLAWANLSMLAGRHSANGYDPMTPLRNRTALGGMGPGGRLGPGFLRSDPRRLEMLGIRWVQVPARALVTTTDEWGLGEPLSLAVEPGRARFLAVGTRPAAAQITPTVADEIRNVTASEIRVAARLEGAGADSLAASVQVLARLTGGRLMPTALVSVTPLPGGEPGEQLAAFRLPGRYHIDAVRVERLPGEGRLIVTRVGLHDEASGRGRGVSRVSAWVSDHARLREVAATPFVRLYELMTGPGPAHVTSRLWTVSTDEAVLGALASAELSGLDPWREALAVAADVEGVALPPGAAASRAQIARLGGGRLDVRATGPGLLVVAESWHPGWSARVDGAPARVLRVNHAQMGVVLEPGLHRVVFEHRVRGLGAGVALAGAAFAGLGLTLRQWRRD